MNISRTQMVSKFNYNISGEILLPSMAAIKDLGILSDPKLKFDCHINNIINRSYKTLGFTNGNHPDFIDKYALKFFYYFLECSICGYGLVIWSSYRSDSKSKLDKIQENCLLSFFDVPHTGNHTPSYGPSCLFLTWNH